MNRTLYAFALAVTFLLPAAAAAGAEGFPAAWTVYGPVRQRVEPSGGPDGEAPFSLVIEGGREGWLMTEGDFDLSAAGGISFRVLVPAGAPGPVRLQAYLKDRDYNWFETGLVTLAPGEEKPVAFSLDAWSTDWRARGHLRGWDGYLLGQVREFGLRFFFPHPYVGSIRLDSFRLQPPAAYGGLAIGHYRTSAGPLEVFGRHETFFELSEVFANPFDPDCVRVDGIYTAPSGRRLSVPAFFHQDYLRHEGADGEEIFPHGRSEWRLRFTPEEAGRYHYLVRVTLPDGRTADFDGTPFEVIPGPARGFVRWDREDPRWLALDDGSFFYPIGHTVRSPDDERQPYPYEFEVARGRGTFAYEDYFRLMGRHGQNFARVWMAPWWAGLEWNPAYASHYRGLGRYSTRNAWLLDRVVEAAEKEGIRLILTLINHGQFSIRPDAEWWDNPMNVINGGFLASPDEFFTSEKAADYFRKRLRYIVARWGYSPAVAFWEMWNEVDLTGYYSTGKAVEWHRTMIPRLREVDPWDRIITTHYCRQDADPTVWALQEVETISGNAYHREVVDNMRAFYERRRPFEKPVFINEFGRGEGPAALENNLHAGIWASSMTPMLGTALFWWWPFIHHQHLYERYRALAAFWEGVDRRGRDLQPSGAEVVFPGRTADKTVLDAIGIQDRESGYFWVYAPGFYHDRNPPRERPDFSDAALRVGYLEPGAYRAEFWDTRAGSPFSEVIFVARGESTAVPLPGFAGDLALKIHRLR